MFEKILFPMDFSLHSLKIIECLGEIPGIKEVIVLHVVDTDKIAHMEETQDSQVKKAELKLAEHKTQLQSMGFNVETLAKVGIPSREIIRTAKENAVSLIAMGARGRSLIRDILLGSVTSDVLRYGNSDVLIMRYRIIDELKETEFEKYCGRIFNKVLYPTDFSTHAQQTLSIIKKIPGIGEICAFECGR